MSERQPEEARSAHPPKGMFGMEPWTKASFKDYALYYYHDLEALRVETLSGFGISILKVPEAIAFSYVAGVHPLQGLYGSFFVGLVSALFGGRPGMISGCSGAIVIVLRELMEDSGPFGSECPNKRREYIYFTMVLAGILQLICGCFHCSALMKLIPETVVLGFFNALAILIFITQFDAFYKPESVLPRCTSPDYGFGVDPSWYPLDERTPWLMIVHILVVVAAMEVILQVPQLKGHSLIPHHVCPPALVGLVLSMLLEWCWFRQVDWDTPVVKDVSRIKGRWPEWHVPDVPWDDWDTWSTCLPYAAVMCATGLIESLLATQAMDRELAQQTCTPRKFKECLAQGFGNVVTGFFSAVGGGGMVGESSFNAKNGAQGRLSAFVDALLLLLYILLLHGLLEAIPTAAVVGVMFSVVLHMFRWQSLVIIARRAIPLYSCATIVIVTVVSVLTNLGIGVGVGVLWECACFVWNAGSQLEVLVVDTPERMCYRVVGKVFFGNARDFNTHFTIPSEDDKEVVIEFANAEIADYSAVVALDTLGWRYAKAHRCLKIHLKQADFDRVKAFCDETEGGRGADGRGPALMGRWWPQLTAMSSGNDIRGLELQPYSYKAFVSDPHLGSDIAAPSAEVPDLKSGSPGTVASTALGTTLQSTANASSQAHWEQPDQPLSIRSDPDSSAKDEPIAGIPIPVPESVCASRAMSTPKTPPPNPEAIEGEHHPLGVPPVAGSSSLKAAGMSQVSTESSIKAAPEAVGRQAEKIPRNVTIESVKAPSEVGSEESV